MKKKAILVGASGATGSSLLFQLLENKNFSEVLVLTRRELRIQHGKLKQIVLDFDDLQKYAGDLKGDVVFCCLGTTRSKTPDKTAMQKVVCQYPTELAKITCKNGAKSFHLMSVYRANPRSSSYYLRIRGEAEQNIRQVPFTSIHIYRPALLSTLRKERRLAEGVANVFMYMINPILIGGMKKFRSTKVDNVARAMIKISLHDGPGIHTHGSEVIEDLNRDILPGMISVPV